MDFIAGENGRVLCRVSKRLIHAHPDTRAIGAGKPDFVVGELREISCGLDRCRHRRMTEIDFGTRMTDFSAHEIDATLRRNSDRQADVILRHIKLLDIILQLARCFALRTDRTNQWK